MRWEILVLLGLVISDILFTYRLLYITKVKLKKKNWFEAERNPIIKKILIKYGLHKGIRISAAFSLTLITGFLFYLDFRTNYFDFSRIVFFAMGLFFLVNVMHFHFLGMLNDEVEIEENKNDKK